MSFIRITVIYILLNIINFALTASELKNNTVPDSSISGASRNNTSGNNAKNNSTEISSPKSVVADIMCTHPKCFMKCCPSGKFFNTKQVWSAKSKKYKKATSCDSYGSENISEIDNLDTELNKVFIEKPKLSGFEVKGGIYRYNKTFRSNTIRFADLPGFNVYLDKDAELRLENPNSYDRFIHVPNDFYCVEFENVGNESVIHLKPKIWIIYEEPPKEPTRTASRLMTTAMLVSCFFLLLVLVVYALLPELRTQGGINLMLYVTCQLLAFLLLAAMRIQSENNPTVCVTLTYLIYFFFLASFSWMNVMAYDIWWTFRCTKTTPLRVRILRYSLYAWGLPLTMTIAMAVVNSVDMRHWPWFVTPKIPSDSCFIKDGEKFLYLYIPMLVLNLINWIFFIMTAYILWRLTQQTAMLDSACQGNSRKNRRQRHRFIIYLKMSILMGLNFVLEVVSYKYPNSSIWFISDFYNILIGVTIFILFVCKPRILKKLKNRFRRSKTKWSPDQGTNTNIGNSTSDSTPTQEMQSIQLSINPKGREY